MRKIDPDDLSIERVFLYAAFAAFAGFVGHVLRQMEAGKPLIYYRAVFESLGSAFVGVLAMMSCQALKLDPAWTGVIVGVSGWLGATATIQVLEKLVYKKLGLHQKEEKDEI